MFRWIAFTDYITGLGIEVSLELAHNIAVIYDRVCLSSKVNLKEFRNQQLQIQSIEESVQQLGTKIEKLEKELIP